MNGDQTATYATRLIDHLRGKDKAEITVLRNEQKITYPLGLPMSVDRFQQVGVHFSGVLISEVKDPQTDRVVLKVDYIDAASLGQQAQVRIGDIVLSINGDTVQTARDLLNALKKGGSEEIEMVLRRDVSSERSRRQFVVRRLEVEQPMLIPEAGIHS